jgi:hypothetical protein
MFSATELIYSRTCAGGSMPLIVVQTAANASAQELAPSKLKNFVAIGLRSPSLLQPALIGLAMMFSLVQ